VQALSAGTQCSCALLRAEMGIPRWGNAGPPHRHAGPGPARAQRRWVCRVVKQEAMCTTSSPASVGGACTLASSRSPSALQAADECRAGAQRVAQSRGSDGHAPRFSACHRRAASRPQIAECRLVLAMAHPTKGRQQISQMVGLAHCAHTARCEAGEGSTLDGATGGTSMPCCTRGCKAARHSACVTWRDTTHKKGRCGESYAS
jgi:hypothetical protein